MLATALAAAALLASPLDGLNAEAERQCPQRPVADLRPVDLRTRLDAFEATLPPPVRSEIEADRASCSPAHDPACENAADVAVLTRQGRLPEAVAFICGTVL